MSSSRGESVAGTLIVIPTYWTWPRDQADRTVEAVFDHPTPVDGQTTLPRLLHSLRIMAKTAWPETGEAAPVRAIVLTATVHAELEQAAEQRVGQTIKAYRQSLPIAQFGTRELTTLHRRLHDLGGQEMVAHLSLRSYPGVRNCGLFLGAALGVRQLVALDDDELVAPDYLNSALRFVGRAHEGQQVLAVAGPYTDADGGVFLPQGPHTGDIFLDKKAIMNQGMHIQQNTPGQLVRTPFAFGGNLVLHRRLFMRVGFDPWITRGEDIDYLINARLQGYTVWWDKHLRVTHLPPQTHTPSTYRKLSQDVIRFVYERRKLRQAGVDTACFDPYPGRFLDDDLEAHALTALEHLAVAEETARTGSPQDIMGQARKRALEAPRQYSAFAGRWAHWMDTLAQAHPLSEWWRAKSE